MNGMGLFPMTVIDIVKADGEDGMMLVGIGGTRVMLCRRMASRIRVEPL